MVIYAWTYLICFTLATAFTPFLTDDGKPYTPSRIAGSFIGFLLTFPLIGRSIGWF